MPDLRTQRGAGGGGVVLVLRFIATAALNYGFGVALAWILPRAEFGAVSVLQNVILLAGAVVTAGLPWVLAKVVAQADDVRGEALAAATFRAALVGNVCLGVALAAGFVAAQLSPVQVIPGASGLLVAAVAATVVLLSVNAVLAGAMQGNRRFDALGVLHTSETVVKVLLGLAIVALLGFGMTGVAFGFLAGAAVATCFGYWALRDRLPGPGPLAGRATLRLAVPMGVGTASFAVLLTLDILALSAIGRGHGITTAVIAGYQAAAILARAPVFIADSLGEAVYPFMAKGRDWAETHTWVATALRWMLLGLVPLQLVLLVAPGAALGVLFPAGYSSAAGLVRLLTVGAFGLMVAELLLRALYARGVTAGVARRVPLAAAGQLVALIVLVPRFGATGAAIGFAAGGWVAAALLGAEYLRHHRPGPVPASRAARYAVALGVLLLGLTAATRVSGPAGLVVIAAALAGYSLAVVALGLLRETERARLNAVASAVGRRVVVPALCILLAGAALLWNITTSPDTQYDEVVYTRAAQEVAQGGDLTWTNRPMFVHPPLSFLAQAAWLQALDRAAAPLSEAITGARLLTGLSAAASILLLALLTARLAPRAGVRRRFVLIVAAVTLAATDPILLRYGRLAIIEPLALLGCLATIYLAMVLWQRSARIWVPVVGLATGLTLLTKEVSVFLLLTPLAYAVLGAQWRRAGRAVTALLAGSGLWLLFPFWALQLGLMPSFVEVKLATFARLIGLVQITGWNRPGASFLAAVTGALGQYATSYLLLGAGALALLWLLLHRLSDPARWLLAWLLTSYAFAAYTVLLGTLNEQFFVFVLPAALVAAVLVTDAVVVRLRASATAPAWRRAAAVTVPAVALTAVVGLAAVSWARFYVPRNDGVLRSAAFLRERLPPGSVVNATGDVEKHAFLLPGYPVTYRASGPGALSRGVHLFLLSDKDAALRNGNASPEQSAWVRANGTRLASFPSATYHGVELWQVHSDPRDPLADVESVPGGWFVVTEGSRLGGFPVVNGLTGDFAGAWATLGGKAVVGPPVTGSWVSGGTGHQVFDGAVVATAPGRPAGTVPVVATMSAAAPEAYRRAGLPPVADPPAAHRPADGEVRARLTDPAIAAAYLAMTPGPDGTAVTRARALLGEPIGPPTPMPDGWVRQPFTGAVLERPAGSGEVRLASLGRLAIEAGAVSPPVGARTPVAPPVLPVASASPQPSTVAPFVTSLGITVGSYALLVALVVVRRRPPRPPEALREAA